jgi:hypothetical protein
MRGLHGGVNDAEQAALELVYIDLIAQGGAKCG